MNGSTSNSRDSADSTGSEVASAGTSVRRVWLMAGLSAVLLWLSQPPLGCWPLAFVALVPWLIVISDPIRLGRREYLILWTLATLYWMFTLQGLRHAHPAIYLGWVALSAYLACYNALFVLLSRRMLARGCPLWIVAPVVWVGTELMRNYLLTGISAAMLGHAVADVPIMIQIADISGTYGVSFVLVSVNVGIHGLIAKLRHHQTVGQLVPAVVVASVLVIATVGYGRYRMGQGLGDPLARFALIQRNEKVEFVQQSGRGTEIFQSYARQSMTALAATKVDVDAVVWPESMFTGDAPWTMAEPDAKVPEQLPYSSQEFQDRVAEHRRLYLDRASFFQSSLAELQPSTARPHLIAGCGVVHHKQTMHIYSGIVHIDSERAFADWYGKTHLMMIGEYIPIVPHIPFLKSLVPPELRLRPGPGPRRFLVGDTSVSPNICIETAVERVTVNQLASLNGEDQPADVVVTVTNDGWFDDSSIIQHHLRCAQLVAVGCRTPVLSTANNGPTAWINSQGQVVESLEQGTNGWIIAQPLRDERVSLYLRIGDWPARVLAFICILLMMDAYGQRRRERRIAADG